MLRQCTAAIAALLTCLMLVVTTTSQLGISYCLCQKTIFIAGCPCDIDTHSEFDLKSTDDIDTSLSCCPASGCHSPSVVITSPVHQLSSSPCTDCIVTFIWELDHYSSQYVSEFRSSSKVESDADHEHSQQGIKQHKDFNLARSNSTRGSPRQTHVSLSSPLPLYKKHSVYLI